MWWSLAAATRERIAWAPPCATSARASIQLEILAAPADGSGQGQSLAGMAEAFTSWITGREEASAKFGGDPRVYLTTATKFAGDEQGHVKEVHTVQIEWSKNEKGQFVPKEVPGHAKSFTRATGAAGNGISGVGTAVAGTASAWHATARSNRAGRIRQICDQREGRSLRRATPVAAKAWWCGPSTRATRRGPRMRPLSDGPDESAVAATRRYVRRAFE